MPSWATFMLAALGAMGGAGALLQAWLSRRPTKLQTQSWQETEINGQNRQIVDLVARVSALETMHSQALFSLGQMTAERDTIVAELREVKRTLDIMRGVIPPPTGRGAV